MDYAHIVHPAEGVQVVPDVTDQPKGVFTIEGEIGPLIFGEISQTYYVEMPPYTYLDPHPHSFEALIYAVRGSFVVMADNVRTVVEPGGLMMFGANVATGYEVPFKEPAFMLVFRGGRPELDQQAFMARLKEDEVPTLLDLADDHPAIEFARSVNPEFAT
ncbi:MAG: cupin domain-containing protein [Anaerolineales bacterium]|nr:cupin domain-containing protein [Anaerolineales bacterium]